MIKKALCLACLIVLPVQAFSSDLVELYGQAIESDPRLNVSRANKDVGSARYDQATSRLLPQVTLSSTLTDNNRTLLQTGSSDHYKGEKYNLGVQQKLFDLNAWHDRKRYQHLSEESVARLIEKEIEVTIDLVARYLDVLAKQDAEELIVAEKNATKKQLELLKSRYKRQLATITDLLEVEARYDVMLADEIKARAEVEIALETLSELVGRPIEDGLPKLAETIGDFGDIGNLDSWTERALKDNPSLRSKEFQVRAQEAGLRQAKAVDYPTVDFALTAQKSDIGFENSQSSRTETYVASLNFSMPLYQGGSGSARKAESRALLRIAQFEYEEVRRNILKNLRASFLNTEASQARIIAAKNALDSAEKSYEAQEKGLTFGAVTVVDVLDALRERYRVRRDYRQAQYDYVTNWISLLAISGELSASHVIQIDSWRAE